MILLYIVRRPFCHLPATHIQEAGDYIMETDMEAVMPIPRTFSVGNVDHMPPGHTMTISLRECANMAYIGNYIGTHILS